MTIQSAILRVAQNRQAESINSLQRESERLQVRMYDLRVLDSVSVVARFWPFTGELTDVLDTHAGVDRGTANQCAQELANLLNTPVAFMFNAQKYTAAPEKAPKP